MWGRLLSALRDADDWLFERGRPRLLFVVTDGYGFACQAPVIRALLEVGGVVVRATAEKNQHAAGIAFTSDDDRTLFARLRLDARLAALAKWHVVVYSHMCSFYPRRRALQAFMHHGPGFGSGGGTYAAEACDIYLGLSNAELEYLDELAPDLFGRDRAFFPVGFPHADALYGGKIRRETVLRDLDLKDRRTILIASKWNPGSLLRALGAGPFEALAEAFPDSNVVQTGHPWLWESRRDVDPAWQAQLVAALRQVERNHQNARFLPAVPAEPLAAASDLLVADGTSVVTMFGLLDRPIAFFDNPDVAPGGKRAWIAYREASDVFRSAAEAVEACRSAITDPAAKQAERRRLREMFYANAGHATEVTARVLRDIGPVCSSRSPGWPGVLDLSRRYMDAGRSANPCASP